ncbi:multimeric flavodoxin WrbA [Candidatus Methanoperedens nitroreducens]|uniref:Multimeric flavodoxin WrbA n=1 Tax=Candidatus Methanoperedens nitratireducens TaxID=1392998 RepID=A0A062V1C8_9EURY|nr:flavodoxin family protein [Candidatus Methanoperedens nitroreducens]KCZ72906.1 multimeric flavodoxin WrbA [Candidatus Methanoperedens nitroreducens]MDJ1423166.1 flavodoxin family protein [Candidatus Methanoperedens sp.]
MKITGISGSPTVNGNNEKVIDLALGIAEEHGYETEKILLSKLRVLPCTDCGVCKTAKECPIDDDMEEIYRQLETSDALIVASPVYFGSVSAQLKALFDRTILLRRNGFLLEGKVGGAIATGGSRNGGQEFTIQAIHSWMHIHGMLVVGDRAHFGGIVAKPVDSDEVGLKTVRDTANMVCKTLKRFK